MSAADKSKVDKIVYSAGITEVHFGDSTNTSETYLYGNTGNKIVVGATNVTDNIRWDLLVQENRIRFFNRNTSTYVYDIYPFSQGEKLKVGQTPYYEAGTKYSIAGYYNGFITNSSHDIRFEIPMAYRVDPTGQSRGMYDWASTKRLMNNTTYFSSSGYFEIRSAQGGYITVSDTGMSIDRSKVYIQKVVSSATGLGFLLTRSDGGAWTRGTAGSTTAQNNVPVSIMISDISMPIWI